MCKYVIEGARRLCGSTEIHGAKNSALPILAASIVCKGTNVIHNCPELSDRDATVNILRHLGCTVTRERDTVTVDSSVITQNGIPDELMREMRSSVIFLGAILSRTGEVSLSTPGGCEIGLRPIDIHLDGIEKLGADVKSEYGLVKCRTNGRLRGTKINLSFPSVGATENIMIAAATADGVTVITNAAREPEISDLADFLNRGGARIAGAGESTIVIEGVRELTGAEHTVIPDRIVAASYLAAAACTGGSVELANVIPAHLEPVLNVFEESGCRVDVNGRKIALTAPSRLKSVKMIRTMPYPGFPTDIQAPVAAMLTLARGTSLVVETIFESRYKYIGELVRFGAKINVDGRMAVIEGVPSLHGASVVSPDLRGGMALIIAGLAAEGTTVVTDDGHIGRGYEYPERVLSKLNAKIKRTDQDD